MWEDTHAYTMEKDTHVGLDTYTGGEDKHNHNK